jgi:hypothetical protein
LSNFRYYLEAAASARALDDVFPPDEGPGAGLTTGPDTEAVERLAATAMKQLPEREWAPVAPPTPETELELIAAAPHPAVGTDVSRVDLAARRRAG